MIVQHSTINCMHDKRTGEMVSGWVIAITFSDHANAMIEQETMCNWFRDNCPSASVAWRSDGFSLTAFIVDEIDYILAKLRWS